MQKFFFEIPSIHSFIHHFFCIFFTQWFEDVTDAITNGLLMVELKITDMVHVSDSLANPWRMQYVFEAEVDECGVDEHLLDGEANVTCEG